MITKRTTAFLREFGRPVLAGVLVFMLFVSALASASPALHHWLHCDDQAPTHQCLVTVLEHGQTDTTDATVSPVPVAVGVFLPSVCGESFFLSHDLLLHPERGPPVSS